MAGGAGKHGTSEDIAAVRACLRSSGPEELQRCVDRLHPSDLAAAACELSDGERQELFRLAPATTTGPALAEMAPEWRPESILASLPVEQGAAALTSIADDDATFGLVVLIAMWGNLVVASFAGAFVPILLDQMGVDPAVASSVFVTTFTDMAGFILLLGLATAALL